MACSAASPHCRAGRFFALLACRLSHVRVCGSRAGGPTGQPL